MVSDCQKKYLASKETSIVALLTDYQVIEVIGDDATIYLQGQLTGDMLHLGIHQVILTAHCDAKGKVWSLMYVVRLAENRFYLMMNRSLTKNALAQLQKYAVFSKITFTPLNNKKVLGIAGKEIGSQLQQYHCPIVSSENPVKEEKQMVSVYLAHDQARVLVVLDDTLALPDCCSHSMDSWHLLDIQDGIARLDESSQGIFIPQALNLDLLENAISFKKGCYIGQETIARAKYRGANKRALFTLVGKSAVLPEIGGAIEVLLDTHWRKTGTVISSVSCQGHVWVQVVLNNDTDINSIFRINENSEPFTIYPLPYTPASN